MAVLWYVTYLSRRSVAAECGIDVRACDHHRVLCARVELNGDEVGGTSWSRPITPARPVVDSPRFAATLVVYAL